jgi:hypothetical protein
VSEGPTGGVAGVAEARLKPNDLTQPDTGRHSLAGTPSHEPVVQRQVSEYSGSQSPLVDHNPKGVVFMFRTRR